jgi:K+-transporting ATPase ATPase A chain
MTFVGWSQIAIVLALTLIAAIPLSGLIVKIYAGEANLLTPVLRPVERVFYRLAGVDETGEQSWLAYATAMIAFSIVGFLSLIPRFRRRPPSQKRPPSPRRAGCPRRKCGH